jgi:hypothetical protein
MRRDSDSLFDVTMCSYDGAEIYELVRRPFRTKETSTCKGTTEWLS